MTKTVFDRSASEGIGRVVAITRRTLMAGVAGLAMAASLPFSAAFADDEKVLRVGMTVADVPQTTGQANQGGEGTRFIGLTLYDALINWDLSKSEVPSVLRPGLATEWSVDDDTQTVWTFKLREGVKFHDGSDFTADAVVWNLEKLLNKESPQYDASQAAQASQWFGAIASYEKIDDMTVAITTKEPDATFPYQIAGIMYSSPAQWDKLGGDWGKFAQEPSGTGPFMLDRLVPRERAELVKNPNYWDPDRVPASDRVILMCMPDASTRVAALLSGQVDFIEAPSPDAVPRLKSSGMQIVTNVYPHIWPYQLSYQPDSPFLDLKVRKAANLAIDRESLSQFLGGLAVPAKGQVTEGHPWFGNPTFDITYDPEQALSLMQEAGYGPDKPLHIKLLISTSGSGQMQPLPMNEFIAENLTAVGFDVEFEVFEWEALRARRRAGAMAPENEGADGLNNSWAFWDPNIGILQAAASDMTPPRGFNWGGYSNPEIDELAKKAKVAFDPAEQDKLLGEIHTKMVDDAMWIWVVHDLNPRALGPNVKGFVQAQNWYQDLTPVYVDN
nr:ABC transporter substrate-binding protein [Acuticoccus sediminis]